MVELDKYIKEVSAAVGRHLARGGIYHGEEGALRLAREVGYGMRGQDKKRVKSAIKTTYSTILVKNTLGLRSGVPLDAKEWFEEMRKAAGIDENSN